VLSGEAFGQSKACYIVVSRFHAGVKQRLTFINTLKCSIRIMPSVSGRWRPGWSHLQVETPCRTSTARQGGAYAVALL